MKHVSFLLLLTVCNKKNSKTSHLKQKLVQFGIFLKKTRLLFETEETFLLAGNKQIII
jgi:hypothetical protein